MHDKSSALRIKGRSMGNLAQEQRKGSSVCSVAPQMSSTSQSRRNTGFTQKGDYQSVQEQYSQSLEQQIQLLELENDFLKANCEEKQIPNEGCHTRAPQILYRGGNEVSLNGRDWCRLPPFHPPLDHTLYGRLERLDTATTQSLRTSRDRSHSPNGDLPTDTRDRRQSAAIPSRRQSSIVSRRPSTIQESPEYRRESISASSKMDSLRESSVKVQPNRRPSEMEKRMSLATSAAERRQSLASRRSSSVDRRQSTVDGLGRRESVRRESMFPDNRQSERSDLELIQKLEEQSQKIIDLEQELHQRNREVKSKDERILSLTLKVRDVEETLSSKTETDARDKRALMEELLELQKRLDDLTPTLAEKEAIIARLENERDSLISSMRSKSTELNSLQLKLSEKEREEAVLSERQSDSRSEITRLQEKISDLQIENAERQRKENHLLQEISELKRSLRDMDSKLNKERGLMEKASEENSQLIQENANLSSDMSRLELTLSNTRREMDNHMAESISRTELVDARESEKRIRHDLMLASERLRAETEKYKHLEAQLAEREKAEMDIRDGRERMQKELDALQALSRSLSSENKALREEKIALQEKIEHLKMKVADKANKLLTLEEEVKAAKQDHESTLERLERESRTQHERTLELEEVSRKLKELSESLPSRERMKVVTIMDGDRMSQPQEFHQPSTSKGRSQSIHFQTSGSRRVPRLQVSEECQIEGDVHDQSRSLLQKIHRRQSHI